MKYWKAKWVGKSNTLTGNGKCLMINQIYIFTNSLTYNITDMIKFRTLKKKSEYQTKFKLQVYWYRFKIRFHNNFSFFTNFQILFTSLGKNPGNSKKPMGMGKTGFYREMRKTGKIAFFQNTCLKYIGK